MTCTGSWSTNDFFEEDIDSVFGVRAIAQPTDVHTGACAHMFHVAQVADVVVSVLSVSYTHLDVYKRQFIPSAPAHWTKEVSITPLLLSET